MTPYLSAIISSFLFLLVPQERDSVRVDVQLAQVVVTVTDSQNRYVTNLKAQDFVVELDGTTQQIDHFTQDADTPVSLGILVDTSSSMRYRLAAARLAASRFIHGMRPADEFFLMTFASGTRVIQDLTQDRRRLDVALQTVDSVGSGTNLFSAVKDAAQKARKGKHRKRAIIVISDGGNTSTDAFQDFRTDLRNAEILMYPVQIQGDGLRRAGMLRGEPGAGYSGLVMHTIAAETGARWFGVDAREASQELINQFDEAFTEISAELRGQYSIGIYPKSKVAPGSGRIRVRTVNSEYRVRYR